MVVSQFCVAVDPAFQPQVASEMMASAEQDRGCEALHKNVHLTEQSSLQTCFFIFD